LAAGIAVVALPGEEAPRDRRELGLFTSLPIYWGESESIAEALGDGGGAHWARGALESDFELTPLDTLDDPTLGRLDRLLMAQPRPLAPAENVALDDWVRGGGRLLLFADPLLTEHSRFGLGDKRRPQDVALLSPILRRWGLELMVDPDQPDRERTVAFGGQPVPVRLAGSWRLVGHAAGARCRLEAESIVARCAIGRGSATIVSDAALLEGEREGGAAALSALVAAALGR
ncbi:MAG: hypothetical protein ACEQR8_12150, partial [Cypionkella sp.]